MFDRIASWPRIIAALVGGIGLSGVFAAWPLDSEWPHFSILFDWQAMMASATLLVLSYLLATGREWARRVLLWTVSLIGGSIVLWRGVQLFPKSYTDLSPEQIRVMRISSFLRDLSWFFFVLTLLIFIVLILSHPDIVASFRRRSGLSGRSNQAIQPPTPGGEMSGAVPRPSQFMDLDGGKPCDDQDAFPAGDVLSPPAADPGSR